MKRITFPVLASLCVTLVLAQSFSQGAPQRTPDRSKEHAPKLTITVTDENGVAVGSARITLESPPPALSLHGGTDFAGRCEFNNLAPGNYSLRVEKNGYYAAIQSTVRFSGTANLDVTLVRQQEAHEVVNVTESAPAIDPAQIAEKEELTGSEILDVPYPGTHDYRNSLFFIPQVTPDAFGQAHIAGAETYQTVVLLDGFNVTQPTNGQLVIRTSVESFRSIDVIPSREPAEDGKGSGGVLALNTRMGDDHFHASAIDFIPGVQTIKGISLGEWNPTATVSGPVRKGKMWFLDSLNGQYNNVIVTQLPSGQDSDHVWQVDNLAKIQSNLTTRNIVNASFVSNYYHDRYAGLSPLQPQSTTPTDRETGYLGSVKDQYYFRDGALLETGFGVAQYTVQLTPQGNLPYIQLAPSIYGNGGAAGNYYLNENTLVRRVQGISNLFLPPQPWHERHDIKIGIDLDRLNYNAQFLRQPISFLQPNQPPPNQPAVSCPISAGGVPVMPYICTRYSVFSGGFSNTLYNTEASAYVEDRWLITNRLLIEPGVRFDEDQIVRRALVAPRLAGTYTLDNEGNTKFSAGIGITFDATSLGIIHQPFEGQRVDYFFECLPAGSANCTVTPTDQNGIPAPAPTPQPTTFSVNPNTLNAPRYLNWSLGFEKKLPYAIFLKLEFVEKRGSHGFAYNTSSGGLNGDYFLENQRTDRYDAFTISARRRFHRRYEIFGAYTRSRAHTNQVFDFSLDIPLISPQLPGPYPWDTPNRFVGYGILPFISLPVLHKVDLVYSAEVRDGLPFYATTDQGEIYPGRPPGTDRLPAYYTINLQFAKRFHFFHRYWELRGGFDNLTNHANAALANGVIDSSHPQPTFIDANGRAFTGRIRFLGKE
ncbi:MAG TPA: carboxypeptidase regulatory-like domain-containing protein [Candidatus Binatia bacterium]|nr:carboxypeptidase regulatory-like domain-containing protein [Candidatus Binatia bacterium]